MKGVAEILFGIVLRIDNLDSENIQTKQPNESKVNNKTAIVWNLRSQSHFKKGVGRRIQGAV